MTKAKSRLVVYFDCWAEKIAHFVGAHYTRFILMLTNFRINSDEVHNPNKNMQIPFKGSTETSLK